MKLSSRARYGVRLMFELALNYGQGVQILKAIAKKEEISEKYLSQIATTLRTRGLVNSDRGAHGGYVLAKSPKEITINEIVNVLEGPLNIVECVDNPSSCNRVPICTSRSVWVKLEKEINRTLESVTLEDLVKMCKEKKDSAMMYNI